MIASTQISAARIKGLARLAGVALLSLFVVWKPAGANGVPVKDPATGHLYLLNSAELNWPDAKAAAEAKTFPGLFCHLAVITSPEENAFVDQVLPNADTWIGGERRSECPDSVDDESFWGKWITGELWDYTNWAPDAPDQCDDSCLMYTREEEEEESLDGGGGAQLPAAVWDEEGCEEELVSLVECEPKIGAPALSGGALAILVVLMAVGSVGLLRRRQRRSPA